MSAGEFVRAASDLEQLLDRVAREAGSKIERKTDSFGFEWLIVRDKDLEDLVTAANLVARSCPTPASASSCSRRRSASPAARIPSTSSTASRRGVVLAVRPDRRRPGARQRRGARAQGEAREGAADRARPDEVARRCTTRRSGRAGRGGPPTPAYEIAALRSLSHGRASAPPCPVWTASSACRRSAPARLRRRRAASARRPSRPPASASRARTRPATATPSARARGRAASGRR